MKKCWICLGTDETETNQFVIPCFCVGDMQYIHRVCFIKYLTNNKKCKFCYHTYIVEVRNGVFIWLYEFLVAVAKYVLLVMGFLFLTIFIFMFLCAYGVSVLYLTMGIEYIQNNRYKVLMGSPLIFISILSFRFIEYNYLLHAMPIIMFLDLSKTEHFFISFIPFMFFFSTGNILKIVESSEKYFVDDEDANLAGAMGIYDSTNELSHDLVMNNNTIPMGKIVCSLLTPYLSYIIGFLFPGDALSRSACGCIVFSFSKQILYFYYLKMLRKKIKSIRVIEPGCRNF